MCSRRAPRSTSCSHYVSTWATAHRFIPEPEPRAKSQERIGHRRGRRLTSKTCYERRRTMNKELGVWKYDDCALLLIDFQKEMFEVIRSQTDADLVALNVRLLAKTAKAFDM